MVREIRYRDLAKKDAYDPAPYTTTSLILALASLLLPAASHGLAQRTTATVYANVQDSTGAVISGVPVHLTDKQTTSKCAAQSEERGDFTPTFLPVGSYRIDVEAGRQIRYAVVLEVGAMAEI